MQFWKTKCTWHYTILISQKIWEDPRKQVPLRKDFSAYVTQEIHYTTQIHQRSYGGVG